MQIPEPETVLDDLSSLLPIVYKSLDFGAAKANEYFDSEAKERDPYVAAALIRFHALEELRKAGQDAQEINLDNVPNVGIYIKYGSYQIRVLKSDNGDLPVPGPSNSRQSFYRQFTLDLKYSEDKVYNLNLIVLWGLNKTKNLSRLALACPKAGGTTRESVEDYWTVKIPKDILYGKYIRGTAIKEEDIYDLPLDDYLDQTGTDDRK